MCEGITPSIADLTLIFRFLQTAQRPLVCLPTIERERLLAW